jgi:PAS domain S-box-containing protein
MTFLKTLVTYGVSFTDDKSEKRNIELTNYIALTTSSVPLILFLIRFFFFDQHLSGFVMFLAGSVILLLPVLLNRFGLINISRVALCWMPYIYFFFGLISGIQRSLDYDYSGFLTIRFFFLGFSCFPFLVFKLKDFQLFAIGLLGPLMSILGFDLILDLFQVGIERFGDADSTYYYNTIRVFISFLVIGCSCYFLKRMNENYEEQNEQLVSELAKKNLEIQQTADNEVHQLNQQLYANLHDLSEREFILNQSQRIAKIGSWEYRIEGASIFWSDEMYNILGLDKSFDVTTKNLLQILWGEEGNILINATLELFRTGKPYDLTLRTKTPIGYVKWFRIYGFPINQDDNVIGVRGVCHDITFYKEAEERLRTGEEKFSKAFHGNPDLITIIREDNLMVIDTNQKVLEVLGYRRDEVIGISSRLLNLFVNQSDREKFYAEYFEQGKVVFECSWRRKDGRIIQVVISGVRIQIQENFYMMSVIKDVTEQKNAQDRFLKAFDLSPDLMLIIRERDLVFVEANRKIEEMSGFLREEVIGLNSEQKEFEIWADEQERKLFFDQYNETGTVLVDAQLRKKNGEQFYATVSAQRIVLAEENHMIVVIRDITERRREQEQLMLSQANLRATINNTEVLIWSVDRSFRLLTFNNPFASYIKHQYNVDIQIGSRIFPSPHSEEETLLVKKWNQIYMRALSGEIITLEETRFGIDFQYSLSPIIEVDQIIGVSIFADNVTQRKAHDRELAEANKKVGELKLLALRSAMSPHFIFNVLNSIQYYIAKNDKLNAINYLSTFSKLIRSILTHSVSNKIKLSEEVEMLKNYIALEMTRFENKFDFLLNVDPELDIENIEIPSLLIQPYVENAILHGLYRKSEKGTLKIGILQQEDTLIIEVEDDGIGREAAIKLRRENFPSHTSMGMIVIRSGLP